jgi:hypothetical protein
MNWYQEGLERARIEGEREGERAARQMLVRQLRLRFGEVPAAVVARIEEADESLLDLVAVRVLTATNLDDVLAPT